MVLSSINLLTALSKLLNCEVVALHDYLNHPIAVHKINEFLKGKRMRTTYLTRKLERKEVQFGGFTTMAACQQQAYEGYLGVSVQQHFYCRHRIRLMYPRMRCVKEYFGNTGHKKYYPPELLEIITGDDTHEDKNDCFGDSSRARESNGEKGKLQIDLSEKGYETGEFEKGFEKNASLQQLKDTGCGDDRSAWYNCYFGNL